MRSAICFLLVLFPVVGIALPAWAALKTMKCDRYQTGADGRKESVFTYTLAADYNLVIVTVALITEPKESKIGEFPLPIEEGWKIIWHSQDRMRAVALAYNNTKDFFYSPVVMIDLDFANVRMQYREAGGVLDFDLVVSDPWKYECARVD